MTPRLIMQFSMSHGSEEGSLKLQELMGLITTLSDRIGVLEADLSQTKKIYSWEGKTTSKVLFFQITRSLRDDSSNREEKDTASEEVPPVNTAEVQVSTAGGTATYSRRSAEKRKDKGKGIMTEEEPKKKSKKEIEQERFEIMLKALRLEEADERKHRAHIARDAEIARQWEEEEKKKGNGRS
ncbi:hypothetical protein Tco_1303355 [Tanacetum coccineum]